MKYDFADTALQSLIDLINRQNGCALNNEEYQFGAPFKYPGVISTPGDWDHPPEKEGTNTFVHVANRRDSGDTRYVGYHRFNISDIFPKTTTVTIDTLVSATAVRDWAEAKYKEMGLPFDEADMYFTANNRFAVIQYGNNNFMFYGITEMPLKSTVPLDQVLTNTTFDYLDVLVEKSTGTYGFEQLIANINQANGTAYKTSEFNRVAPEDLTPDDPDTRTNLTIPSRYAISGTVYANYNRWPYDLMRPDGITMGAFKDLDAFKAATTSEIVKATLIDDCIYPLSGNEYKIGEYTESDTYPHFRLGITFLPRCYHIKTVDTLYLVGGILK